jgi:2-polyprenyl-3-methyl-5-hydroxy-6-metoxy-1,4-benzoquinol methylase
MSQTIEQRDQFYAQFFIRSENWSSAYPNADEATRAGAILALLAPIANAHYAKTDQPLEILDAGCGRGWLTSMLGMYGRATGIDPVAAVVEHARVLYPQVEFEAGEPDEFRSAHPARRFDVVVSSEVIEHVELHAKESFLRSLAAMLRPGGTMILTTPRRELFDAWKLGRPQMQPVEQWLREDELSELASRCGLKVASRRRCGEREFRRPTPKQGLSRFVFRVLRRLGIPGYRPIKGVIYQVAVLEPASL